MKTLLARKPEDRSAGDPTQASRPFSIDRAGFVLSEGAGMLVLATESAAEQFGLRSRGSSPAGRSTRTVTTWPPNAAGSSAA